LRRFGLADRKRATQFARRNRYSPKVVCFDRR
jgi:hypothetical protein